jgi:hypothetical protein
MLTRMLDMSRYPLAGNFRNVSNVLSGRHEEAVRNACRNMNDIANR